MRLTNLLVLLNVLVYGYVVVASGGRVSPLTGFATGADLLRYGALYGPNVAAGEWWRIVTAGFLHDGLTHIALNMFALYQVGTFVESALGAGRMLAIYVLALIGSGLAVVTFAFYDPTVGASGAIFGLFGALLAIGVRYGRAGRSLVAQTVPLILINLAFTFSIPSISKAGHLGGLIVGTLAGFVLFTDRRRALAATANGEAQESEPESEPPA